MDLPPLSPDPAENERLWSSVCPVWRTWVGACFYAWEHCHQPTRLEFPVRFLTLLPGSADPNELWVRARYILVHLADHIYQDNLDGLVDPEPRSRFRDLGRKWLVYPTQERGAEFLEEGEPMVYEILRPMFRRMVERLSLAWDLCNPRYEDADPVEATAAAGEALNAWTAFQEPHRNTFLHLRGINILRSGFTVFRDPSAPPME